MGVAYIGRYEVVRRLGEGGMGEVYLARDPDLERNVALKVLHTATASDPAARARFRREARALASLNHPGIVIVHEIGTDGAREFIAMEFLAGRTLREELAEDRSALAEVLSMCRQVALALAAAHEAGVLHRDVKPDNVMVAGGRTVKVVDFGLARRLGDAREQGGAAPGAAGAAAAMALMTADDPSGALARTLRAIGPTGAGASDTASLSGTLFGTPTYMAPEQLAGADASAASDAWAFGALLYEAVAGRRPFEGDSLLDGLRCVLAANVSPARLDLMMGAPKAVADLAERLLAPEPEARPSMSEAAAALDEILATGAGAAAGAGAEPTRAVEPAITRAWSWRSRTLALGGAAVLVLCVTVGLAVPTLRPRFVTGAVGTATGAPSLAAPAAAPVAAPRDVRLDAAWALAQHGEWELARARLDPFLVDRPDDPEGRTLGVLVAWFTGEDAALAAERAAAAPLPPASRALVRGASLLYKRREAEAIAFLESANRDTPGRPEILFILGEAYWHGMRRRDGVATLEHAFEIDPRWQMALHHAVDFRFGVSDLAALRELSVRLRSVHAEGAAVLDAQILFAERRYADAAAAASAALALAPDAVHLRIARAEALVLAGDLDGAEADARAAFERAPLDPREEAGFAHWTEIMLYRGDFTAYQAKVSDASGWLRDVATALWRPTKRITRADVPGAGMLPVPLGQAVLLLEWERSGADDAPLLALLPDPEMRSYADGLRAERRGDVQAAAGFYRNALRLPSGGELRMLWSHALARVRHAARDRTGAAAACDEVLHPRRYFPYRAVVLPDCLVWTAEAASDPAGAAVLYRRLADTWRGPPTHPSVALARARLRR